MFDVCLMFCVSGLFFRGLVLFLDQNVRILCRDRLANFYLDFLGLGMVEFFLEFSSMRLLDGEKF